jgi:hypothetical protein
MVWPNNVRALPLKVNVPDGVGVISEKIAPTFEGLLTVTAFVAGATLKSAVSVEPGTVCGVQLVLVFQSVLPTPGIHVKVLADAGERNDPPAITPAIAIPSVFFVERFIVIFSRPIQGKNGYLTFTESPRAIPDGAGNN